MSIENPPSAENLEIRMMQIGRAMRFAVVGIVVGLSMFDIRTSLSINLFHNLFREMLNGRPLPGLTRFVVDHNTFFFLLSAAVPLVAIATLFFRDLARSFYILGFLICFSFIEFYILYEGLSLPLGAIVSAMENVK